MIVLSLAIVFDFLKHSHTGTLHLEAFLGRDLGRCIAGCTLSSQEEYSIADIVKQGQKTQRALQDDCQHALPKYFQTLDIGRKEASQGAPALKKPPSKLTKLVQSPQKAHHKQRKLSQTPNVGSYSSKKANFAYAHYCTGIPNSCYTAHHHFPGLLYSRSSLTCP